MPAQEYSFIPREHTIKSLVFWFSGDIGPLIKNRLTENIVLNAFKFNNDSARTLSFDIDLGL